VGRTRPNRVIGGLTAATFLTLIVVPVVFFFVGTQGSSKTDMGAGDRRHHVLRHLWFVAGIGVLLSGSAKARVVTIEDALEAWRKHNMTLQSSKNTLSRPMRSETLALGMFLPKAVAQGQWLHMGERHMPDLSSFTTMVTSWHHHASHHGRAPQSILAVLALRRKHEWLGKQQKRLWGLRAQERHFFRLRFLLPCPSSNPEAIPFVSGAIYRPIRCGHLQRVAVWPRAALVRRGQGRISVILTLQSLMAVTNSPWNPPKNITRATK